MLPVPHRAGTDHATLRISRRRGCRVTPGISHIRRSTRKACRCAFDCGRIQQFDAQLVLALGCCRKRQIHRQRHQLDAFEGGRKTPLALAQSLANFHRRSRIFHFTAKLAWSAQGRCEATSVSEGGWRPACRSLPRRQRSQRWRPCSWTAERPLRCPRNLSGPLPLRQRGRRCVPRPPGKDAELTSGRPIVRAAESNPIVDRHCPLPSRAQRLGAVNGGNHRLGRTLRRAIT